jgi:cell division protein FtsQ
VWNNAKALTRISNAMFLLAIAVLLGALFWRIAHMDVFSVRAIDVVGDVSNVTEEQVKTIVGNQLYGTFFTVDLQGTQTAFEKLPWVRRVDVRRRWPNALEVIVEEHRELARWGNTALVNTMGEIFEGASNRRLPVLEGPAGSNLEVTQNYFHFNKSLSRIGREVRSVRLSQRRAWRLTLDDGTVIALGRHGVVERLSSFVAVYERSVADLKGKVRYVDLRYVNGFAVQVEDKKRGDKRA